MKEFLIYYINKNKISYFLAIIKNYKIINKLGYFIIDNNIINDKMLYIFSLDT
jgi:hypothetical protein